MTAVTPTPSISTLPERAELLMPAGSLEKLKAAVLYGADAIYVGTPDMSLRTRSAFTMPDLLEGMDFAHAHGKRVYLTLNLFSHNRDIEKLPGFIETIRTAKPDGVIVADSGVFQYVKDHAPELELHVSTQANVCSWLTVDFWQKQGAALVVLAREVSFAEIQEIREKCPDIKLEMFVHGAMCMTYSGRCLLSNFMAERGSNQGNCAHSCRWDYKVHMRLKDGSLKDLHLTEETKELFEFFLEESYRPGEMFPLEEDSKGSYILNSKDLCLMPRLPEILSSGMNSLKVEGRNKSAYYVAMVTRAYRMAIDDWYADPDSWSAEKYMQELFTIPNRGYTLGFHDGRLSNLSHNYFSTLSLADWEAAGVIRSWDEDSFVFEVKNFLLAGDLLEFISPTLRQPIRVRLQEFTDARNGKITDKVSAGQDKAIRIPTSFFESMSAEDLKRHLPEQTIARREKPLSEEDKMRVVADLESQRQEIERLNIDPASKERQLNENREMLYWAKQKAIKTKGPRMGLEGCCGKGCNGCLLFWKDDKYANARVEFIEASKVTVEVVPVLSGALT